MQKRGDLRQECLVPVRFTCSEHSTTCYARMINYGKGGMCLKTRTPLKPGTTLQLALEGYTPDDVTLSAYAQQPVTVCWAAEERERGLPVYQAGVRYSE